MHIETERKFLVKDLSFKSLAVKAYRIKQGYIAHDGGNTVRVRVRDQEAFLTIKGPSADGMSRQEWELRISPEDAQALLSLCRGGFIDKTRYLVPEAGIAPETCGRPCPHEWEGPADAVGGRDDAKRRVSGAMPASGRYFEVDEFYGDNEGLVMAELELSDPDEPYERPAWLGEEVTGDRRYYNSHLLLNPYKHWGR